MQDRYFGDVGDFGKYGLLRALCGMQDEPKLKLGVVWYLFPDEDHNADGKHLSYLRNERHYRDCDEQLFRLLHSILFDASGQLIGKARQVLNAEMSGVLPEQTQFYSEPLAYANGLPLQARIELRRRWLAGALEVTSGTHLVFLDPDNGIECSSVSRASTKGPKFVYWDEIEAFAARGQSVLVYHHLCRTGTHNQQIQRLVQELRSRHPTHEIFALKFKRGSGRVYLLLATAESALLLRGRIRGFLQGAWNRHFDDNSVNLENLAGDQRRS